MSRRPDDFHALHRRVRLTGVLTTRTGLRIGAGSGDSDAVDLPVLRDAEGFPFIPGASIKGVIRSTLESLLPREPEPAAAWACDPLDRDASCGSHGQSRGRYRSRAEAEAKLGDACTVCRLLGSQVLASHVRFSDALVLDRDGPPPIERRDGVGIDRDLKAAASKIKYDFQVVPPGVRFGVELFADNLDDTQLGLLLVGFDQLAEGFTALGGFTSRGLGRVELRWTGVTEVDPKQLLRSGRLPVELTEPAAVNRALDGWRDALTAEKGA